MRPVMKNNPWPGRLQHFPMAGMLILIAIISTKPITLIGLAISLCTIPFLCLFIFAIGNRWNRRFGGSKLMNIIALILFIVILTTVHFTARNMKPYIGEHFCQSKRPTINKCFSNK